MKKLFTSLPLGLVLLAWAVGAPAQPAERPDRDPIDVTVVGGRTTVVEEVARTTSAHGGLVWKVQDGYLFAANGIVIEAKGADKLRCEPRANGKRFRCAKLRHISGDRYKYVVNLVDERTKQPLAPLDPYIQND